MVGIFALYSSHDIVSDTENHLDIHICGMKIECHSAEDEFIREGGMKRRYRFVELSQGEKEFHEMVLLEELDIQSWYSVVFSCILGGEIFLLKQ